MKIERKKRISWTEPRQRHHYNPTGTDSTDYNKPTSPEAYNRLIPPVQD
jgi:hypothetical protein